MTVPLPSRAFAAPALLCLCAGLWSSCGRDVAAHDPPSAGTQVPRLPPVEFDFGVVPHGQTKVHDFVLDPSVLTGHYVPLRVQLDCSCGRGQLLLRAPDGTLREIDGAATAINAAREGDAVIARVFLDTLLKDPVDLPHATSRGSVILQPVDDPAGARRVAWPLILRFGIDCPVDVEPVASIAFEKVPLSARPERRLLLSGDAGHAGLRFLAVATTHPSIQAELVPDAERTALLVRCLPDQVGSYRGVVRVDTDHPDGYAVNLSVTWKVVPDLEAYPLDKLSFRALLERAQTAEEASSQYLQVADHAADGSAEFRVVELVGDDGRDASSAFEVTFRPIEGRDRHQRVHVRYLGGLEQPFRGRLVLAPARDASAHLTISLVVFAARP